MQNTLYYGDNLDVLRTQYYKPALAGKQVRALQIRTISQLLSGDDFDFPLYGSNVSLTRASRLATTASDIGDLFEAAAANDNPADEPVQ